jgi:uncharacterized protein YgiM (DUF1202 family)
MEDQSISIATIHKGEEMELGKVSQKRRKTWVEITLPGDQKGYISGDTKIFAIRKASVAGNPIDMKETPSADAPTIKTLVKGAVITVTKVEKTETESWYKVHDEENIEGFIPSSSKLRVVPELTRSGAVRNMVTGLIFVLIGIFLTISNYKNTAGQTMLMISYAVIFFGLLQLGQGVVEYVKVNRAKGKNEKK